jgi:hypothetical protein
VLRDTVGYRHARRTIASALTEFEKLAAVPTEELEDEFAGVELGADLRACVPVGPYHAIVGVTSDLRRVQTICRDETGRESSRKPPRAAKPSEELDAVEDVRRRLRALSPPFDQKPARLQGILTVTPDGTVPHTPMTFSAGSNQLSG